MRIAQLANFVGPTSGGMKVVIDHLAQGYVEAGHERVFVMPGRRDLIRETDLGIVAEVGSPRISPNYRMILQPWQAFDVLKKFGPTSIEVSDKWTLSPAGPWARRHGVGSVLFSHERLAEMMTHFFRRAFGVEAIVGAMNRRLSQEFDAVVVTSRYAAGEFDNTGARLELIPLGVDLTTFHPSVGSPVDDGSIKLVYCGRLSREKMPHLAIAAAVALHERGHRVRLDMYGAGPHEQMLRDEAGDAPVHFHGFVASREDVARCYAAADISMSVSPTETFGLAVLEAMACGTPVVTSTRGGGRELVDESSGAWARPDGESLADAVESLLPRLGTGLRAGARRRAELYTWDRTVEQMLALHASVGGRMS